MESSAGTGTTQVSFSPESLRSLPETVGGHHLSPLRKRVLRATTWFPVNPRGPQLGQVTLLSLESHTLC